MTRDKTRKKQRDKTIKLLEQTQSFCKKKAKQTEIVTTSTTTKSTPTRQIKRQNRHDEKTESQRSEVRGQVPTRRGEAAVHIRSVPGLNGAVDRWQRAERSLTGPRRDHDDRFLFSVLVLLADPRPQTQAGTDHARLRARH